MREGRQGGPKASLHFLHVTRPVLVKDEKGHFVAVVDEDVVEDVRDVGTEGCGWVCHGEVSAVDTANYSGGLS